MQLLTRELMQMSPPSVHRSEQQLLVSQESFQQSLRYPSSNQDQVLNPCGNKDTHNDLRRFISAILADAGSVPGVLAVAITHQHGGQQAPGVPVPGADAAATTPVKDPYRIPTNPGRRQLETTPASTNIVIV
ncbi:hypothetical protein ACLKA7_007828 [Drosophila subpalustris]